MHAIPQPPGATGDIVAKPAVIVGLAQAHASGVRGRGRADEIELGPGVRMKPGRASRPPPSPEPAWPPPAPEPPWPGAQPSSNEPSWPTPAPELARAGFIDAPTRLAERLPRTPEAPVGRPLRRAPAAVPRGDFGGDVPTRAAPIDPRILAESAHGRGDTGELDVFEDPTRAAAGPGPFASEHDKTSADFDIRMLAEHRRHPDPDPDFDFDDEVDPIDEDVLSATLGHGANGAIDLGPREQSRRYPRIEDETPAHDPDTAERPPFRRGRGAAPDEATRSINAGRPRRDWENE